MTLIVDLGQSGSRIRVGEKIITSTRGKLAGEHPLPALRAIFESTVKLESQVVALSCTGFGGVVTDPQPFAQLCNEFFGAQQTAVMDDGFAGFVGALGGSNGVVLSIGGGVVSVGGRQQAFAHRDGLGSTFGDEGGGFWLGKLGITKALGVRQGRGEDRILLDIFGEHIHAYDELDVKNGPEAASLAIHAAKDLLHAADQQSPLAIAIRDEGAALLAQTVVATWIGVGGSEKESPEIAIQGGPSRNSGYVELIQHNITKKLSHVKFIEPRGDNLDGAHWISENILSDVSPLLRWFANNSDS